MISTSQLYLSLQHAERIYLKQPIFLNNQYKQKGRDNDGFPVFVEKCNLIGDLKEHLQKPFCRVTLYTT